MNKKLIKNFGYIFTSSGLTALFTVLASFFIQHNVNPSTYGLLLIFLLIIQYSNWINIGVFSAMNRNIPIYLGKGNLNEVELIRGVSYAWSIKLFVLLIICSIVNIFIPFYKDSEDNILLSFTLIVGAQQVLMGFFRSYYSTVNNFKVVSQLQLITGFFAQLLSIVFIYCFKVISVVILSYFLANTVALILAYKRKQAILNISFDFKKLIRLIKIGFPIMLIGVMWLLYNTVDRIMIVKFLGIKELGLYGISINLSSVMGLAPQVISQVLYPRLGFIYGKYSDNKILADKIIGISYRIAVISPLIIGMCYFLIDFVVRIFLKGYIEGVFSAQITILFSYFMLLSGILGLYFNIVGKQLMYLSTIVTCFILNILLNYIVIFAGQGIKGIALATGTSYLIYFTLILISIAKDIVNTLKIKQDIFKIILKFYFPFIAMLTLIIVLNIIGFSYVTCITTLFVLYVLLYLKPLRNMLLLIGKGVT
jgi:O-antigen/teichoic acid export membrane protein